MPDERRDSIEKGISAPEESPIGQQAAEERKRHAAEGSEIGGGAGGTSDVDTAADEADYHAREHESTRRADRQRGPGEGAD